MLYLCYIRLNSYFSYESISTDGNRLNQLKRLYEDLYLNDRNSVPGGIKDQVQFQLMRQSFISPVELPVLTEVFLRRDFNFSKYIGYCLTDFVSLYLLITFLHYS